MQKLQLSTPKLHLIEYEYMEDEENSLIDYCPGTAYAISVSMATDDSLIVHALLYCLPLLTQTSIEQGLSTTGDYEMALRMGDGSAGSFKADIVLGGEAIIYEGDTDTTIAQATRQPTSIIPGNPVERMKDIDLMCEMCDEFVDMLNQDKDQVYLIVKSFFTPEQWRSAFMTSPIFIDATL